MKIQSTFSRLPQTASRKLLDYVHKPGLFDYLIEVESLCSKQKLIYLKLHPEVEELVAMISEAMVYRMPEASRHLYDLRGVAVCLRDRVQLRFRMTHVVIALEEIQSLLAQSTLSSHRIIQVRALTPDDQNCRLQTTSFVVGFMSQIRKNSEAFPSACGLSVITSLVDGGG